MATTALENILAGASNYAAEQIKHDSVAAKDLETLLRANQKPWVVKVVYDANHQEPVYEVFVQFRKAEK